MRPISTSRPPTASDARFCAGSGRRCDRAPRRRRVRRSARARARRSPRSCSRWPRWRRARRQRARLVAAADRDEAAAARLAQSRIAAVPTPPPPPCTSALSRGPSAPRPGMKRFENAVRKTSGNAPAFLVAHGVGHREDGAVIDAGFLGVAAAGEERHDALARPEFRAPPVPISTTSPAHSMPEDVRRARRRRIHPLALQQVGAVDRRRADADAHVRRSERWRAAPRRGRAPSRRPARG